MEKPLSLIKLSLINSRFQGRQHTFHAAVSAFSCGGNHQLRSLQDRGIKFSFLPGEIRQDDRLSRLAPADKGIDLLVLI
jgi:hypothetical protein